jgi:hypothetical protein
LALFGGLFLKENIMRIKNPITKKTLLIISNSPMHSFYKLDITLLTFGFDFHLMIGRTEAAIKLKHPFFLNITDRKTYEQVCYPCEWIENIENAL